MIKNQFLKESIFLKKIHDLSADMVSDLDKYLIEGTKFSEKLYGFKGKDILFGLKGNDKIYGGFGNDTLYGGSGRDKLLGGKGNDKLFGDRGSDKLYGGAGKDRLYGNNGNDSLKGGSNSDKLYGGAGSDQLYGGKGKDKLFGGTGSDQLYGGKGKDKLFGGAGSDQLYGGRGSDKLFGNNGNDYLFGEAGLNYMNGGAGNDSFALDATLGFSYIEDFSIGEDLIVIQNSNNSSLNLKMDQSNKDVELRVGTKSIGLIKNISLQNLIYKDGFIYGFDDFSSDINTSGMIEINSSIKGNIEQLGDRDWFSIILEKDKKYQVEMNGSSSHNDFTLKDSFLYLRGSKGNLITSNDDSGEGLNSKLIFTSANDGIHFLDAGSYRNHYKGTYSLSFSEIEDINGWSNYDGWGQVNAAQAFENLLGFDLQSRGDFGGNLWGIDSIDAQDVWIGDGDFEGVTGEGVTVAVLDTGIDYSHNEFEGRIVQGWDFVDNDPIAEDGNGHGTHVAGTIAGSNDGFGITGVAFDSYIMPIRVLNNEGLGTYADVNAGIRFAVDNGANVVNLSLGGGGFNQDIYDSIRYASERGSVVVMSAGNDSASQPDYPALYATDFGIAVGASSEAGELASFSNLSGNYEIDYVTAPGLNIYSSLPGNDYSNMSGTSMAAPHVSGIAALLSSYDNQLTTNQIEHLISTSSQNYDKKFIFT